MRAGDHIHIPGLITGWLLALHIKDGYMHLQIERDGWTNYVNYQVLPIGYPIHVTYGPTDQDLTDLDALEAGTWDQTLGGAK